MLRVGHARDELSGAHGLACLAGKAVDDPVGRRADRQQGEAPFELPGRGPGELDAGGPRGVSCQRIEAGLRGAEPLDGLAVGELVRFEGRARNGGLLDQARVRLENLPGMRGLALLLFELSGRPDSLLDKLGRGGARGERRLRQLRTLQDDERRSPGDPLPLARRDFRDCRRLR